MKCHFCACLCDPSDFHYCCGVHICFSCNQSTYAGEGHSIADHRKESENLRYNKDPLDLL